MNKLWSFLSREFRPSALSFLLLAASASAGWFGGGAVSPHAHSSASDGGRITNLSLLGAITAVNTSTFSAVNVSSFSFQSLGVNGYQESGGLLRQWGLYGGAANRPVITYTVPFNNGVYGCQCNCVDDAAINGCMCSTNSVGNTTFIPSAARHDASLIAIPIYWECRGKR